MRSKSSMTLLKSTINHEIVILPTPITLTYCLEVFSDLLLANDRGNREFAVLANEDCHGGANQMWYLDTSGNLVSNDAADNRANEDNVFLYVTNWKIGPKKTGFEVRASQTGGEFPAFRWIFDENGQIRSELHGQMCLSIDDERINGSRLDVNLAPCDSDDHQSWGSPY